MVTSIQLGNFFSSGGKTVSGGTGGSGIDTQALITGLTGAKKLPADNIQKTIDANAKVTDALSQFKTLLSTLKDAVSFLRNPPGVGNQAQNAFAYTSASVVSNTSTAAENYLAVSSSPGVSPTTYNISQITSVASAKKQTTASFAVASADTSVTTAASTAGSFKAGTVAVKGVDITLETGDTLNEIAAKFNAVKSDTGIIASVVQAGTNDFRLNFTSTTTGTSADFDLNSPSAAVPADADGVFSMIGRTNLLTNGTFDANITGWTNASIGTGSTTWDAGGAMSLAGGGAGGNEAFAQQAMTTQIGQTYTVRMTMADLTHSAFIRIGTDADVTNPNNSDVANYEILADGTASFTFTATSTTSYLTVNSDTNTTPIRLDDISVVNNATQAVSTTQAATDAVFVIDGITVTRPTNSISDVYSGVTFDLKQATPALTTLSATINVDTTTVQNGVVNFINAYNDLRVFAAKQSEVDNNGQYKDTAVLANNSTFRNTMSSITSTLTQVVSGISNTDPNRLADIGVTFADLPASADNPLVRNILDLNSGTLASKLAANFDAFRRVFEFDLQSSNSNLRVFSRTNALTVSNFTLDFTAGSTPTAVASYNNGSGPKTASFDISEIKDNSTGEVLGYTLKGQSGTPFAGLQLIYASTSSSTMSVTATQGLADKIFNLTDGVLTKDTGALDTEVSSIVSKGKRLQDQIDKITLDVERFRQQLLDKFAAMEQAIAKVNNLLQSISANNQAKYGSSE